jgi:Alginate export
MWLPRYLFAMNFAMLLVTSASAGSVDFGGTFFNLTGVGNSSGAAAVPGGTPGLVQEDILKAWVQAAFTESLSLNVQVDGTFNTAPVLPFNTTLLYANADLLNVHGSFQMQSGALREFRFTVGRLVLSDFTTRVLSHEADGLFLDFDFPGISLNVGAGYTGLVTKGASTIELSKSDLNDYVNTAVNFASPRLIELVQATLLTLPGQTLAVSGILQQDLRGTPLDLANGNAESLVSEGSTTVEPSEGGRVNTQYAGVGVSGNIVNNLYYDMFGYLETGQMLSYVSGAYQSIFFFAALAGGGLRVFLPDALSSAIAARVLYASGDPNTGTVVESQSQGFSVFTPISRPTLDNVFSPQLSNLLVVEASYSLKPLSRLGRGLPATLQTGAQTDVYFRPTSGAISEPGVSAGGTDLYLGTEIDLGINFSPLSDVGSSLWGGVFLPGSAFTSGAGVQYKTGLNIMVNF